MPIVTSGKLIPFSACSKIKDDCRYWATEAELQPGAYFMAQHIKEGKEELNFDEFNNYSKRRKKAKIKSIISQIEKEEMPLKSYLLLHPDAGLTPNKKKVLLQFFQSELEL